MDGKKPGSQRKKHAFMYPKHMFNPEELLTFVEMNGFYDEWLAFGLDDEDLDMFQAMVMAAPTKNPEVKGTGGFRIIKMTRGPRPPTAAPFTVQVGYVYFAEYSTVLLVISRTDDVLNDISEKGRESIRRLI